MNIKNNIFVSAVAMIDVDSRILISNRKNRKQLSNYWEFQGGKVDHDENFEFVFRQQNDQSSISYQ